MRTLTIGLFCILIAGCNYPASPPVASVQTAIIQTQQVPPTQTFVAQLLDDPIPTPTPSATLTPAPVTVAVAGRSEIATQIARPGPIFEYARIYGLAHLENGHFLITLEIPGLVSADYQATLGGEPFRCQILAEFPNRLYCNGLTSFAGQFALLQIREPLSQEVVYETEIGIPLSPYVSKADTHAGRNQGQGGSDHAVPTPSGEAYPGP